MVTVLKELLQSKNDYLYQEYLAIEALLLLLCKSNKIRLYPHYLTKVINVLLTNQKIDSKDYNSTEDFFDNIISFLFEIIELYKEDKFSQLTFILKERELFVEFKEWIITNKELINDILNYYFITQPLENQKEIYSDNLFKITEISMKRNSNFLATRPDINNLSIRVLLSGKIYYGNGVLVNPNEYTISNYHSQLKNFKILTDDVQFLTITLKQEFIENFDIFLPDKVLYIKSTINLEAFTRLLDPKIFYENFFLFFEMLTLILKVNSLIPNNTILFSELFFNKKIDIRFIINNINQNLKKPEKVIKEFLLNSLEINSVKLDNIFYNYYNTTFKRYLHKIKCKHIIEEYITTNKSLEEVIEDYNYSDIKNFKYNINSFFNINIRELNKYKKQLNLKK